MRKRPRQASFFRPGTSELERHQGVSVLLLGGAAIALSSIEPAGSAQFAAAPLPQGDEPERHSGHVAPVVSPTSPMNPASHLAAPASHRMEVASGSSPAERVAQPAPPVTPEADLIRPLALAPSPVSSPPLGPRRSPPQSSNQASDASSSVFNPPVNSVIIAAPSLNSIPTAASGGGQGSPPALLGVTSSSTGSAGAPVVAGSPAAAAPQAAKAQLVATHERKSGPTGDVQLGEGYAAAAGGATGGLQLGEGYAATGGGSKRLARGGGEVHAAISLTSGTGPGASGPGSGSSSGSESDPAESAPSGSSYANKVGAFSFTTKGPFGNKNTYQGSVELYAGGQSGQLVGGSFTAMVRATAPGPGMWEVTSVEWGSEGSVPMYSTQSYAISGGKFVNTPYNLGAQTSSNVGFYWGETPGDMEITATATVTNTTLNLTKTATEASTTLTVNGNVIPDIKGAVKYESGLSIKSRPSPNDPNVNVDWLSYGSDEPGERHGISWAGIYSNLGATSVVQIINSAANSKSNNNKPPNTAYSPANEAGAYPAPFPLVDGAGTSPFYSGTYDSPGVPLTGPVYLATMGYSFTDYVMFKPPGGIWVPAVQFSWVVGGSAKWTGTMWAISQDPNGVTVITPDPITPNRSWPKWNAPGALWTYWTQG
jgi:hypothetical protein